MRHPGMQKLADSGRQRGFSLIEVLVALLILSIGLLGVAGLQTRSLQMNQSAYYASQANLFAKGMVEAMRVNSRDAELGRYDISMGDDTPGGAGMPTREVERWIESIRVQLPMDGNHTGGAIAMNGDTAVVEVAWLDARWEEDENERVRSVILRAEL